MEKGTIRDVDRLDPELAKRVKAFLAECKRLNIAIGISETLRTVNVQKAYFAQGRESLTNVNVLRKRAGLYLLNMAENSRIVTNTLNSRHISGKAIDLVPLKNGGFWWTAPEQVWQEIGALAEKFGLDWCAGGLGKRWGKGWDNPHFELMENWGK